MNVKSILERLLHQEPLPKASQAQVPHSGTGQWRKTARDIVEILLDETQLPEASIHRPKRGSVWVAAFTGPAGQVWRSTGLTDRAQALLVARRWEAQARVERAKRGQRPNKPLVRIRHSAQGTSIGLTQKEVGLLLGISERAVRAIEHRAIQKLKNHPLLREIWQEYLRGKLEEHEWSLTAAEVAALFAHTQNPTERRLMQRILRLTQRS
jgi:hypothetical protein